MKLEFLKVEVLLSFQGRKSESEMSAKLPEPLHSNLLENKSLQREEQIHEVQIPHSTARPYRQVWLQISNLNNDHRKNAIQQ